jgi:hypothetical protein
MKAKMPFQGRGIWGGFWFYAYNLIWPKVYDKIDINENVRNQPGKMFATVWCTLSGTLNQQTGSIDNMTPFGGGDSTF